MSAAVKIAILCNTSSFLLRARTELIHSLQASGAEVIAVTPRDESSASLEPMGVRWREWGLEGQALNPFKDFASIVELHGILKEERPDAVLNFTIKPVLYGSLVAAWLGVPRVVSMITGMGSIFLPGGLRQRLLLAAVKVVYRRAMRRNDRVIFQNDEDLDYFVHQRFLNRDKAVRINGSGVNLSFFTPRPGEAVPGSFLLVARMIKEKGLQEFVQAARAVKSRHPSATFTLVGPIDNNPGAISREEIAAWEREGVIRYEGVQADVRPFIARTAVYVLPTYYLEGTPRSILEALAMAKPVITTDWRGCRDTVRNGYNGFLVPPKDAAALEQAMECFLNEPGLADHMGLASRRRAETEFDVVAVNAQVIQALTAGS